MTFCKWSTVKCKTLKCSYNLNAASRLIDIALKKMNEFSMNVGHQITARAPLCKRPFADRTKASATISAVSCESPLALRIAVAFCDIWCALLELTNSTQCRRVFHKRQVSLVYISPVSHPCTMNTKRLLSVRIPPWSKFQRLSLVQLPSEP